MDGMCNSLLIAAGLVSLTASPMSHPDVGREMAPGQRIIAVWKPDWPEPRPELTVLASDGQPTAFVLMRWTYRAKDSVPTEITVYDDAKRSTIFAKLRAPDSLTCGVGAHPGMRMGT